ncbi:pentapeptide repeat-containing protein [Anabaena sphaerica FACHB-251]|uniref:Pentapeptide repeat-containing protein n=1 Tax=Anabaena sphaerica FACHB-251 TaxID=2692883 RepID=A0A927A2G8_9NOST|nr:pentapeptide repeat-containing protein [Anabaena sphaerica]MBD2295236.1 pentapeptide repeat-containing protein [Anabaena sphaerica FACHB-251]
MATLWKLLTRNIYLRDLNWGQGVEVVKTGSEAAKAVLDLAKAVNEQKSKLSDLKPYAEQISSLLDVLNGPLVQVAGAVIPFAPIALTMIKLIIDQTNKELNLEQCVALVSQAAYLESFQELVREQPELIEKLNLNKSPASDAVAQKIKKLGEQELDERDAKKAIVYFHESKLAASFNEVLQQRLQEAGLEAEKAEILTEQVARKTDEYLFSELVKTGDKVKQLVEWYSVGGKEQLEKYLSIEDYLEQQIKPKPEEKIFDEKEITFRDLYVPLQVRPVDDNGKPVGDEKLQIEEWVIKMLTDSDKQQKVLFIQGEAGRGKSVFSRMFADRVRRELHPSFTPILIRLRDLRVLGDNLTETLKKHLETVDFVQSDSGWLTDKNTQFLFLLDGFDELLLERRESREAQEVLQQVESFQNNSHHRFLVTGRPLALQNIERLITQTKCLTRVELQPMDDEIRETWLNKWEAKFGNQETTEFKEFLESCPEEIQETLAREPLLLYLLARMHREKHFNAQMFAGAEGIKAKIRIYDESIKWVLEKQRQDENLRLAGLESEDLREFLTEVALCVVQSGNESANIKMLEARIKDNQPIANLLQQARKEIPYEKLTEQKTLNNLVTAFYIKPASGKEGGSMEFVHKSFGEFLFAERLVNSFCDWTDQVTKRNRQEDSVSTDVMDKQIYDLLGYGNLTPEIVEYLMGLLAERSEFNAKCYVKLFQRLEEFYLRWCDGEFIDAPPETEILPLFKKEQLKKLLPEREKHLGLRQVDVYTGLNVLILLLELHRYAKFNDDLKDDINFHPCGQPNTEGFDDECLLRIIGYSQCLGADTFNKNLGFFLSHANLSGVNLDGADLYKVNLSQADLSNAKLKGVDLQSALLYGVNLTGAYLNGADLYNVNLNEADLTEADLMGTSLTEADLMGTILNDASLNGADLNDANLIGAKLFGTILEAIQWNNNTRWVNALWLHEALNVPSELAQQPLFSAAVALSEGMSLVGEGKFAEAIQAYNQALSIDPNLQISAESWNILGWFGTLHGDPADVIYACENAVASEPEDKIWQDSRGLARALTGNLTGALTDFQSAVDSNALDYSEVDKQRRLRWIEALKAGLNPFTPEELEEVRKAEGMF